MEYYLATKIDSRLIRSPFREDQKPTCGFYYGKTGRLYLHDFGTGEHFDAIEIVRRKFRLSFPKALDKIVDERHNFTTTEVKLDDPKHIEYVAGNGDLSYFYQFGITDKTLKKFGVSTARAIYIDETLFWRATDKNPIFVYRFASGKIKLYRPLSTDSTKK